MFDENLMNHVGRRIMRKTDAMRGVISGLMHADHDPNSSAGPDDMVFELTFDNGEVFTIAARSKVWADSIYKFV